MIPHLDIAAAARTSPTPTRADPAESLEERLRRLREEYAPGSLLPAPPPDAPPPPRPWCDVDDRDDEEADD